MKTLLFLSLFLTSQAFAVSFCTIKGTSDTAGYFPGDNLRGPSIYVKGRGYFTITRVEDEGEILISERGTKRVVLDFTNKKLTIDGIELKLVKCQRTGAE